ncbi:MAG: superoxide dismutase, Ni [Candidatus Omnitrophica bacterium CG11_big_fil_rev_8_21_14_0_20_63_9]|nr:MAG: superoxide dismutase, Ni [Candidatus Omnitrophica bacterium CG11_big_fil_rev_8_21_14_0_20_63_9]
MSPIRRLTHTFDRLLGIEPLHAHCDVPCGIYDPHGAQLGAKTVFTMVKKMTDLPVPPSSAPAQEQLAYRNTIVRMTTTKEDHARLCKQELLILWTDYFKPEHLSMFPDLHETFWKAAKLCSADKQNVDLGKAQELVDAVNKIAEMFQKAEAAKKK